MENVFMQKENVFLNDYATPHSAVPFSKIKLEDYEEAVNIGICRDREQIERIATNAAEPTFANTLGVVADDNTLERATTVLFNLCSAETSDELEAIARKVIPAITDHANAVATDKRMYERVRYIKEHEYDSLTPEQKMLTDKTLDSFIRHGIGLSDDLQERFRAIDREVQSLTLSFSRNKLKATNQYRLNITDRNDLDGLPPTAVDAAACAAREAGESGWTFTLHQPSMTPFMTYSTKRELRRRMYMAKNTLCTNGEWDNTEIVRRIVNLRQEFARLLGYDNFADFVLEKRMAKNKEQVCDFINRLLDAYLPAAQREIDEVAAYARQLEGDDFVMQPWDFGFYSHLLKKERYDIDSELLRPYLQLDKVKQGVFGLATKLYGITFKRRYDIDVYHKDVETYDVEDGDGRFLAVLYTDFHPRSSKKSGAWMTNYKEQFIGADGIDNRPHVSIVMNFTRATDEQPSLLTLSEVQTFLHEFGHALHGIFSQVRYQALSGTNVSWDFVELPSQIMENWATEPEWLSTFACHYLTGEPIPDELIQGIIASRNFLSAYACVRQLSFCFLDMAYYTLTTPLRGSIKDFEDHAWARTQVLPWPSECCMSVSFDHIMSGGYAAGYYSYKWAELLDADAFSVFRREGIMNSDTARRFRNEVLSRGATDDPMNLYRRFRGGDPTIDALLERDGIK